LEKYGWLHQGEDLQRLFYFKIGGNIRERTYSDSFFWKIIGGSIRESIYSDCFIGKISFGTLGRGGAANII